jgi:hypothetical protein
MPTLGRSVETLQRAEWAKPLLARTQQREHFDEDFVTLPGEG